MKIGRVYRAVSSPLGKSAPLGPLQDNANTIASGTDPFIYDVAGTTLQAGIRLQS